MWTRNVSPRILVCLAFALTLAVFPACSAGAPSAPAPSTASTAQKDEKPVAQKPVEKPAEPKPAPAPEKAAASSKPAQPLSIRAAVFAASQKFIFQAMAQQGFAKKRNLTVETQEFVTTDAQYTALRGKAVDVGISGWTTAALYRTQGVDLVNVYSALGFPNEIMVVKNSPIQSVADLKGKRIGNFTTPAGTTSVLFRLESILFFGFDPYKDATVQQGAAPMISGLLDKGELDAIINSDPPTTQMLLSGNYRSLGNVAQIYKDKTGIDLLSASIISNDDFGRRNPEALSAFIGAFTETMKYLKANRNAWDDFAKESGLETPEGKELFFKRMSNNYIVKWDEKYIAEQLTFAEKVTEKLGNDFLPPLPKEAFSTKFIPKD